MVDRVELIKEFMGKIKSYYPKLYISFDYDEELDEYEIWHNDSQLEFQNSEFKKLVGELAQDILFDNNVYNFSFGYDHYKSREISDKKNKYSMRDTKVGIIKVTYSNVDRIPSYSTSIDITNSGQAIKLSGHAIESSLTKVYLANNIMNVGYNNIFNFYGSEVA